MYVSEPRRRAWGSFLLGALPETLAATARLQIVAAAILLAGAFLGASLADANPASLPSLVPGAMYSADALERLATSPEARERFLASDPVPFGLKSLFGAGLFVHNTRVGLFSFAVGILAGLPTVLLVLYNGLTLGAFCWIFSRDAAWLEFWAWILPHAVPELLAILLCSTGGLLLGRAVVAPGREGAGASVRAAAGPALRLVVASVPLFVAAALIESFVRESAISTGARYAVALAALATVAGYALLVRHLVRRRPADALDWLTGAPPPGSPDSAAAQAP